MEQYEERLIQAHLADNPELNELYRQHQELKRRLESFRHKLYLTPEEAMEEKRIQKLKLESKDRIMALLARYREKSQP